MGNDWKEIAMAGAIELKNFIPYLISTIHNTTASIFAQQYSTQFGLGLNEWSCIALLASEDDISATRICEVGGFDRSIVSRSINALIERGYVTSRPVASHNRKRLLNITPAGRRIHDQVMEAVLIGEDKLLQGLNTKQRSDLLRFLQRVHHNALDLKRSTKE